MRYHDWIKYFFVSSFILLIMCLCNSTTECFPRGGTLKMEDNFDIEDAPNAIYRIYSFTSHKFLSSSETSRKLMGDETDLVSNDIVWEWIIKPNKNVNLKNNQTNKLLCFNSRGRPVLMSMSSFQATPENCDLNITHYQRYRYSAEETYYTIQLVSRPHWYVGFCPNGHAFVNARPRRKNCRNGTLVNHSFGRDIIDHDYWNKLNLCSPVPDNCRNCSANNFLQNRNCPDWCPSLLRCRADSIV